MFDEVGELQFPQLEEGVLALWKERDVFETLRRQNRGGPAYSFLDGPITANNPRGLGVHHAWGRTYKDIFQRHRAMQGCQLRYQNGFDCQGLWVEVEVEKDLGLDGKRAIQTYGLERFARLSGAGRSLRPGYRGSECPPGPVDGLGQLVPHLLRREHRAYLALPEGVPSSGLAVPRQEGHALVYALRDLAVPA